MKIIKNIIKKYVGIFKKNLLPLKQRKIPLIIIQTTDYCNLDCYFCTNRKSNKEIIRNQMDFELFKKIVDDYKGTGGNVVRLSMSENFMNPKIIEFIRYCSEQDMKVRFTTNGQLFNENIVNQITSLGNIERINISIEGCDKSTYEEIRSGGSYEKIIENLKILDLYRKKKQNKTTVLIQSVIRDEENNKQYLEKFINTWKEYCDGFNFMKVDSQGGNYKDKEAEKYIGQKLVPCSSLFKMLAIKPDGSISACCVDYMNKLIVGDIRKNTIKDVWNSKKMNYFRKMAKERKYDKIANTCVGCTSTSGIFLKECAKLNNMGRSILDTNR